jgi:septal ring factor EnvC (AmiA/AmiB activator)
MFGKGKNVIGKLAQKSQKTLDIFNKTITELTSQNQEIDEEIVARKTEVERLHNEAVTLDSLKTNNQKVIEKINKIFE